MPRNFITNARETFLKARICSLTQHSWESKFLEGFLYFSGWQELYSRLETCNALTLKILAGMDVDRHLGRVLEVATLESEIPISEQDPKPFPDRKAQNDIVFNALGLVEGKRKEVYRSVPQFLWEWISKAEDIRRSQNA